MNPKYKKYLKTSAFAIVAIVAIFLGYLFFGKEKETPIEVQTVKMSKGAITTSVTATGTVEPVDQVEVGTQVSGLVDKIYVDYIKTPQYINLTQEQLDDVLDNSQVLEFPDYDHP